MFQNHTRVIRARWIVPVNTLPIANGWVRVGGGKIHEVGSGRPPSDAVDLGDVALLPRLVNAHTHLEFSDLKHPVGTRGIRFTDWIKLVIEQRLTADPEVKDRSIFGGVKELWDSGTIVAGEITTPPQSYAHLSSELDIISFAEILGLQDERFSERFEVGSKHCEMHPLAGLSPHAPYSISSQALEKVLQHARLLRRPVAMHVAESPEERELLSSGDGPMADFLETIGIITKPHFPWSTEPFDHLIQMLGKLPAAFLIHGNDLQQSEIEKLAKHKQITVVYCPRTHDFFDFPMHPVNAMHHQGVRVVLGTDSRASNPDLNLWNEVRFLLNVRQDIEASQVLKMATLLPAEALANAFPQLAPCGAIAAGFRDRLGLVSTTAVTQEQLYRDLSSNDYRNLQLN
ncbi:MAG: amidohydrolase family protein [Rubripirellula sp.]|nr:amidohydrolase family protein [Rubripirellula sp.]